ncbi:universal stress protein [Halorubellus salinus]|uniref:universal stress protein n=1 Tax=Halorubellus salinus TaxID=755309 RepID=UPI001D06BEFA|nr:universal stress protein [Halorubellus salinus]
MGTILLATDGSEYAREAATEAIELATAGGHDLHVICVVDERKFGEPALSSGELATIYAEDHADVSVREVMQMADASDVTVDGDTRRGTPHEVILEYADEVDATLVVVGEQGDHDEHFSGVGRTVDELSEREVRVVKASSTE